MGITSALFAVLTEARINGFDLRDVCTVGKQNNYLKRKDFIKANKKLALNLDSNKYINFKYIDDIFKSYLGSKNVESIDFDSYENASIIHNLNQKIDKAHYNKYNSLIDSGSFEHLFDIKTVLQNYSNLLKTNGNLFISTCANNSCGHGLYQFSPEFFLSVFNKKNGFKIQDIFLEEYSIFGNLRLFNNLFRYKGKKSFSERTILINNKPIDIIVHIVKEKTNTSFENVIQTDYSVENLQNKKINLNLTLKNKILNLTPKYIKRIYEYFKYKKEYSLRNKKNFEKIDI
jgi:hypothetical protein